MDEVIEYMPFGMDMCVTCHDGYDAEEGQCFLECCDYKSHGFDAWCDESQIYECE